MYCKVQRGLTAAQIERGSLCVTEVRPAPAGRELEPPAAAAAVAQSRGKESRPLKLESRPLELEPAAAAAAAVAQRVEVKGADLSKSD